MFKRIVSLLLSTLLWACASTSAWALDQTRLAEEVVVARQWIADLLKRHGADNAGCMKVSQQLELHRFGIGHGARLQLLSGSEALAYQMRWKPHSAVAPLSGACGWTHIAAYVHSPALAATKPRTSPKPQEDGLPPEVLESWPWLLGGLMLVTLMAAVFGAAAARWRTSRLDAGAHETAIRLPETQADGPHSTLDALLQERAELLAELRAAGIDLSAEAQRLQRATSSA